MLGLAPHAIQRARDRNEVDEEWPRFRDQFRSLLGKIDIQPGLAHGGQHFPAASVGAVVEGFAHGAFLGRAVLARPRKRLADTELRLCHAFGGESAAFDRVVGETDAQHRVRQLACRHRSLLHGIGAREQRIEPGFGGDSEIFGLRDRQRNPLLRESCGRQRPGRQRDNYNVSGRSPAKSKHRNNSCKGNRKG